MVSTTVFSCYLQTRDNLVLAIKEPRPNFAYNLDESKARKYLNSTLVLGRIL